MHAMDGDAVREGSLKKIPVENLIIGMYVAALDRPWLETKFATQGFYLRSERTIASLRDMCAYVLVDPRRYDSSLVDKRFNVESGGETIESKARRQPRQRKNAEQLVKQHQYPSDIEFKDEIEPANRALDQAVGEIDACLEQCLANGTLDGVTFRQAIEPIVASVLRNKDAASALVRMRSWDSYTYSHSISCAVWAALLGRELGYAPKDIESISIGCALMDIGKTRISKDLLDSEHQLDCEGVDEVRRHVEYGVDIALNSGLADPMVIHIIQTHHERFDGTGYPDALANASIPMVGRIAGLVDSYDAMISPRSYAAAKPSYQALLELERNADVLFQQELVNHFISAVGIFPVGSVVELNTGEVAIVTKQHAKRRLRPQIMLILDQNKLPRNDLYITDLCAADDEDTSLTIWIEHELPKDSHGIDVTNYFL